MSSLARIWDENASRDAIRKCYAALPEGAANDYRQLAALFAAGGLMPSRKDVDEAPTTRRARILGIGGGQGAGKTTLSRLIASALEAMGHRVCLLSLDDFYLTRRERAALAAEVHPLFETRGPPGTHDLSRLAGLIEALAAAETSAKTFRIPVFDKAQDDRVSERLFRGPVDWILLEGWCVGARPLAEGSLAQPLNALEAERDAEGAWRRYFADALEAQYAPLWADFDTMLYLRVPSLEAVRRWRLEQERAHPVERRMNSAEVAIFVQYYERITRAMWAQEPVAGQITATLGEDHEIVDLSVAEPAADAGAAD